MVKLNKSPLPDGVSITSEKDYRSDPIFSIIRDDCYNKCYLCEEKEPTGLQVEHRVAHKGNHALKHDWNNLLMACYHCNHAKGSNHNGILDCTKTDPEEYVAVTMISYPKEYVSISILNETDEAKATAVLLEHVYNGATTTMLQAECENLRNKVMKELTTFQQMLMDYQDEPDQDLKQGYYRKIIKMISRSAAFAAFKRTMIRDDATYRSEFGAYLA